jgi:RNA polymerase sigma-32 factor
MNQISLPSVAPGNALALAIANPGALGTIEAYVSAVNQIPMLSAERETALAHRYREQEDLDAARELVLSHLRLVVSVARQYLGYGLPHADLIQEGNIGLMKAVKRFDPDRGVRLVSFAIHWVKAEIHEYVVRNWRMVKIATTKAQRKLFFNLRSMKKSSDTLTPDEIQHISEELNVRQQDVMEMEQRLSGREMTLDGRDDDEEGYAPSAWLSDGGATEPTQVLERRAYDELQTEGLRTALDTLAAGRNGSHVAGAGRRIRCVGGAYPSDRIARHAKDAWCPGGCYLIRHKRCFKLAP